MAGRNSVQTLFIALLSFTFGCGTNGNTGLPQDPGAVIVPDAGDIPCPQELKVKCYDSNPCTEDLCLPNTFECQYNTAPKDGNACTNGDRCVLEATCSAGVCEVASLKTCTSSNPCRLSECDPDLGVCVFTDNTPFGTPCDDGHACTLDDRCESGQCTSGAPVECDDNNPCTTDSCLPEDGSCAHTPLTGSGALCDDGNECTVDSCDPVTGSCLHNADPLNGADCDEANLCTNTGTCNVGICNAQMIVFCADGDLCTADSCVPDTGECVYLTGPSNGLTCDDGNPCTDDGKCANGFCIPGQQKSCNDDNPCTQDVCYQSTGCCRNNFYVYDGIPCDDGDLCTQPGICNLGDCEPGNPIPGCCLANNDCDDNNSCTENVCVNNQCSFVTIPLSGCCDGDVLKKCSAGDLSEELCVSGTCGWNGSQNSCGTDGGEGAIPLSCPEAECSPQCVGKACGADGCGGSCGVCTTGSVCGPAFTCVSSEALEIDFGSAEVRGFLDPNGDGVVNEFTDVTLQNGVQIVVTKEAQISDQGIWGTAPFCIQGVWLVMPGAMAYSTDPHNGTLDTFNQAPAPTSENPDSSGLPGKMSIHTWAGDNFDEVEFTEVTIPYWSDDGLSTLDFQTPAPLKVLQLHFGENGTIFKRINID